MDRWSQREDPFADYGESLELATRLRFPFKLDELLGTCRALYQGRVSPADRGELSEEAHLAAQMLAIVWFRHHAVHFDDEGDAALMTVLGAALRKQAGRLATIDLVEVYLRLLSERGGSPTDLEQREVLLLGDERIVETLAPRLGRVGCRTVASDDLVDARTVIEALAVDDDRRG